MRSENRKRRACCVWDDISNFKAPSDFGDGRGTACATAKGVVITLVLEVGVL